MSIDEATTTVPLDKVQMPNKNKYSPAEEDNKHKKEFEYKAWRQAQWEKDPSLFVHKDDIVVAIVNTDKGEASYFGNQTQGILKQAVMTLQYVLFRELYNFEMNKALNNKMRKDGIVIPEKSGEIIT